LDEHANEFLSNHNYTIDFEVGGDDAVVEEEGFISKVISKLFTIRSQASAAVLPAEVIFERVIAPFWLKTHKQRVETEVKLIEAKLTRERTIGQLFVIVLEDLYVIGASPNFHLLLPAH
jgi:hypothetical protein